MKPADGTEPDGGEDDWYKRREKQERIRELENAGIMKRYRNVTFENIEKRGLPDNEDIRKNYKVVKEYATRNLEWNLEYGFGLILAGNYGTMKTTMAVAVLQQWIKDGHSGLLVPMCSLIDNLYTMRSLNREEWAKYEKIVNANIESERRKCARLGINYKEKNKKSKLILILYFNFYKLVFVSFVLIVHLSSLYIQ